MSRPTNQSNHGGYTSETEVISGTESFLSDHGCNLKSVDISLPLDALFAELKEESQRLQQGSHNDKEDASASNIRSYLASLPKLESDLEKSSMKTKSKDFCVKIDDSVVHRAKVQGKDKNDAGDAWFNLKSPHITPDIRKDLMIIKQRSALDPKRHYKKDNWKIPKHFQLGTIIEGNTEFYSARMTKSERGRTLVDEILNDEERKRFFRRKYKEIQAQKTSGGKAHYKKLQNKRKNF